MVRLCAGRLQVLQGTSYPTWNDTTAGIQHMDGYTGRHGNGTPVREICESSHCYFQLHDSTNPNQPIPAGTKPLLSVSSQTLRDWNRLTRIRRSTRGHKQLPQQPQLASLYHHLTHPTLAVIWTEADLMTTFQGCVTDTLIARGLPVTRLQQCSLSPGRLTTLACS
jgi:hypothetical protein